MWAYGVTVWELFTYGEEPWIGCRAADVLRLTESGERLRRPEYASPEIADLMTMCWFVDPEQRPKFGQLRKLLQDVSFSISPHSSSIIKGSTSEQVYDSGVP